MFKRVYDFLTALTQKNKNCFRFLSTCYTYTHISEFFSVYFLVPISPVILARKCTLIYAFLSARIHVPR